MFFQKIAQGLKKTKDSLVTQVNSLFNSFTRIDEELFEELEETLIMADVGTITSAGICEALRQKVKQRGVTDPQAVKGLLCEVVQEKLTGDFSLNIGTKPSIVMVVGVNGVGKTTAIGKLAACLKSEGKKVMIAAADTFRAGAIDQLEVWAQRSGSDIIKQSEGSDPAAVVFDAIHAAKSRGADVLLCDTAGRLHNKKNLMDELGKISRVLQREAQDCDIEVLLVLDATTGQNAVQQARLFAQAANITGIVLTKLDGTAKGGVVIGIIDELGVPVKYIGVGEQIDDLQPFDPEVFARALFEE